MTRLAFNDVAYVFSVFSCYFRLKMRVRKEIIVDSFKIRWYGCLELD